MPTKAVVACYCVFADPNTLDNYVERENAPIDKLLLRCAKKWYAAALTGPKHSGKTTTLRQTHKMARDKGFFGSIFSSSIYYGSD